MQHNTAPWPADVHGCEEARQWGENRSNCQSNVVLCCSRNANKLSCCNSTDANLAPMLIVLLNSCSLFISVFFPDVLAPEIPPTNLDGLRKIRPWAFSDGRVKFNNETTAIHLHRKVQTRYNEEQVVTRFTTQLCVWRSPTHLFTSVRGLDCFKSMKGNCWGGKIELHQNQSRPAYVRVCPCAFVRVCC